MKKQIKRFVLSVLVLTMVFSCIPATTYAKEQFKWSKSLVLSGKMYHSKYYEREGDYSFAIFSDNGSEVIVKNFNGTIGTYSRHTPNNYYQGDGNWVGAADEATTDIGTELADQKKNHTYTIEVRRGWNFITMHSCTDTKFKTGQTIKCKITAKDANIILMASGKRPENIYQNFPSKKKYNAFVKWWMPQYKSLQKWEGWGEDTCNYIAEDMKIAGMTDKKVKALSKEIQQYVENKVQKSKTKGSKILSYKEVVQEYVDSIDGFKEKLCAVGDLSDCDDYFVSYDDGVACWNWLQSEINGMN